MSDQATTHTPSTNRKAPLFPLGQIASTIAAHEAIPLGQGLHCLIRHVTGDWGVLSDEDKASNDRAVKDGDRILSAYPIDPDLPCAGFGDNTFWIITEADRSVTTFLLPNDY